MLKSLVSLTTVCALALTAPLAFADPEDPAPAPAQPVANDVPPGPDGEIASAEPGNLITPDGWTVTVAGKNESLLPVAPLTTALSSREYIVGGSFVGAVSGAGKTKLAGGSLEAGYQIGCGIMGGPVELTAGIGLSGGFGTSGLTSVSLPINGLVKVDLKPGQVTIVPVNKKAFEGKTTRTTITGFRIKIDSCVGQSFIRSYATMTSSTDNTDDVVTYMGVTKAV
ncbi:MspA family porin [Mycobacteroides immunogenum]|uniref:MspA protein n=1 Tax=Mycobacteroides immunogenum TaxID=83262 RepID=A0A0N1CK58_9MYCO|nr:MspA family porin [Mycobacteroides immunogenum]AMT71409.1 MspA protein [Mycobacteroides immunogenum]ANO04520.1 MspA protein [Mycobacteroides immunogenum]KIU42401.1 MspA protein [Mycobacteroides immunogenum]KPG15014.1 MspA protein [Mycobacteroides immunogenum]KPG15630.1 MspA protein [Mycobacteroides immunogenum]